MIMKSFPIVLQHDSIQCCIACLIMVCKYFDTLKEILLLRAFSAG